MSSHRKSCRSLYAVAREFQFDRIELEQQIVSERAHQREPGILLALEFADQRAQNRKRRGLLAALFFREQGGQRFQPAAQRRALKAELLPMRMALEQAIQHLVQHFAARVQAAGIRCRARRRRFRSAGIPKPRPSANIAPDIHSPTTDRCRDSGPACRIRCPRPFLNGMAEVKRVTVIPPGVV